MMKKNKIAQFSERYLRALRHHVDRTTKNGSLAARRFGQDALLLGWQMLDLARVHEQALVALNNGHPVSKTREALTKHAAAFFLEAAEPIEQTHRAASEARITTRKLEDALQASDADLMSTQAELNRETNRSKTLEGNLSKESQRYKRLLAHSTRVHTQMRGLVRQVLSAQEDERKQISRELHDEIAQPLAGVNVQLAVFKASAALNNQGLNDKIATTQRLVEQSVYAVHQFARSLRPAVLDDLGLIPALRSYLKALPGKKDLKIHFTASNGVESMNSAKRTVLYRVAQEALTNITRHAKATVATIQIKKIPGGMRMDVTDDGKSFRPDRIFASATNKRLGLLGMRERVEMVGGTFTIDSAPGKGTTVRAEIPFNAKEKS